MAEIDFFLSHNRAEKPWTRTLNAALQERGASTFFDEESVKYGDDIVSAIGDGLERSKHIVFVISPRSVQSQWVELEWASALYEDPSARKRRILPVLKEDCDIPFVMRRLKYVDARDLSADDVAEKLMSVLYRDAPTSTQPTPVTVVKRGAPLIFGAPQYIEREADSQITSAVSNGVSVLLYGPRKTGKTSMLFQTMAKENLYGNTVIWLDLLGIPALQKNTDSMLNAIGAIIARQVSADWQRSNAPASFRIHQMLAELTSSSTGKVILFLDEYDRIMHEPALAEFGNLLRALLSDPMLASFCCVAAGFFPPWTTASPLDVSPWWNLFYELRIPYFSCEQVAEFCQWLGRGAESYAGTLTDLTGGHPFLVALAGYEYSNGKSMEEILADPLNPGGPFAGCTHEVLNFVMRYLEDGEDILRKLLNGENIPKYDEREKLWSIGLIPDLRTNPPKVNGRIFVELITQMLS